MIKTLLFFILISLPWSLINHKLMAHKDYIKLVADVRHCVKNATKEIDASSYIIIGPIDTQKLRLPIISAMEKAKENKHPE